MQKLSGKRIGSGRYFGKCGFDRTPKVQPADGSLAKPTVENLSGYDGGNRLLGVFLPSFFIRKGTIERNNSWTI